MGIFYNVERKLLGSIPGVMTGSLEVLKPTKLGEKLGLKPHTQIRHLITDDVCLGFGHIEVEPINLGRATELLRVDSLDSGL